jgi:hypothetical protein
MKSKLLHDENGLKTLAMVFDRDDQVRQGQFANTNRLADAQLTAIRCPGFAGVRSGPERSFSQPLRRETP